MKTHIIFGLTVLVLIIAFMFGSSYYKGKQAEKIGFMAQENASIFIRDHSQMFGSDDAKVYLIEFMDPACETCAAFSPFIKQIMDANPGKIKHVIRYAPFHHGADNFVKILEAAKKQGKYWETLDIMYKSQRYWASHSNPQPQKIWQFIPQAGVNVEQIRRDMNDPAIAKLIDQDLADAKTLNVRKTPGFFVNGKPLQTFGSRQLLQLVQDELLANYPN
ncbi:MAG: DsbA family protein [Desulfobulbaceae bacterium]|jgi:protein-disulfide isomerase|nr:DsbA family protein [Desulfobulbaceae bacterium]MDH3575635.1 DsbA family protein [Desulfobacteraceae bacterium]MDH3777093.1 DsbA family protein [Desulfobulbaceae bacterium]MDH3781124.1 DsbA family protein [Desulfobulbaceae bacterium]HKJ13316.1 thioredoxin domain-containing protein [Desulfobulbales bacterium]